PVRGGGAAGRPHPGAVHRAGRIDHGRTRCGHGEARLSLPDVRTRRHRRVPPHPHEPRPAAHLESRQDGPATAAGSGSGRVAGPCRRGDRMAALGPDHVDDVVAAVGAHTRVVPHGALTKAPLVAADDSAVRLDMTGLTGVTEYDPGEFTFSAR